jgi:subtilase family serine protease
MLAVKSILLAAAMASLTIAHPLVLATRNLSTPAALPDYIVTEVSTSDYDTVKVRVKNQGVITAGPCYMAITIKTTDGVRKVFSPKVNGLAPTQETEVTAKTGLNLIQADYEALVDRSNTVKESDETNNTLKGKFGGKP